MSGLDQFNQQKKDNAEKKASFSEPDELEDYLEMPHPEAINSASSVFDRDVKKKTGGINTAPSIFDRAAVFRTESDKDE